MIRRTTRATRTDPLFPFMPLFRSTVTDVAHLVDLSCATMANIHQNVMFALGLKRVFLITTGAGRAGRHRRHSDRWVSGSIIYISTQYDFAPACPLILG